MEEIKINIVLKTKKSSKCLPKKKKKKNLTCPVDRDHLYVMKNHFEISRH